jgi:putative NADH-flavin reductase
MKVLIFGATGSVGMELVTQALNKNYEVTAFVRNDEKLRHIKQDHLSFYKGDVTNINDVDKSVQDHDAVLCALGDGNAGKVRAIGTKNIIDVMYKKNLKRLVCQTTLGLGDSYGNLNFMWKHIMFGIILKKAFKDHILQEQYIMNSKLDYTIVRPSALVDGSLSKDYKVGFDGKYKKLTLKISRKDVADFMLSQLHEDKNVKRAVSISN